MHRPTQSPDLQHVSTHTALWYVFDPSAKADLYSTVISTAEATWLVDPTPLPAATVTALKTRSPIQAVIVTNQNHWRASGPVAEELSIPILAHADACLDDGPTFTEVADGQLLGNTVRVITIEGAVRGEIALVSEIDGGTMIVGDALINFEPYGFTFLPRKYCTDYRKMRRSLHRLSGYDVRQMFFAHGLPILSNATARLNTLLSEQ